MAVITTIVISFCISVVCTSYNKLEMSHIVNLLEGWLFIHNLA